MQPRKEEDPQDAGKLENSNFKLSTNLSAGELSACKDSVHKQFAFQSSFREIGPPSPQLFSHQKKSAVHLGYSPYLPTRSPELVISRFMKDRQQDLFDIFEYKHPMVDPPSCGLAGFGEPGFPEHRTERRISFRKEQEDLNSSSLVFTSPNKKTREKGEDHRAVNSLVLDQGRALLHTPERGADHSYFKHVDSTAVNTSERRYPLKTPEGHGYRACRLALETKLGYSEASELRDCLKASKGLKTLSQRVKEIVCEKRKTSYKEVASILIDETRVVMDDLSAREEQNIKRRVYDALNVLIASDVLVKENKSVFYKSYYENQYKAKHRDRSKDSGRGGSELMTKRNHLMKLLSNKQQAIQKKKTMLQAILVKVLAIDEILKRNKNSPSNSERVVSFPFIMVTPSSSESSNITLNMGKANRQLLIQSHNQLNLNTDLDVINLLEVSNFQLPGFCDLVQQRFGTQGREILRLLGPDFLRASFV